MSLEQKWPKRSQDWFKDISLTNNMAKAEAAVWYATAGMSVFPCNERKEPLTQNGYKDATDDAETVKAWWEKYPEANIGMAMEQSGLYAVDVDHYAGGRWDPPAGEETLRAVTTSSGVHHVYKRGRDQTAPLPGKAADHIDVKDKGYILVAPSVAVSKVDGNLYMYSWDKCMPPQVSEPVFRSLTERPSAASGLDGASGADGLVWANEIGKAKSLKEGEQRDGLRALCASLRSSGWSDRQALPMLYLFVSSLVTYRHADPWMPAHADKMWADTKANPRFDPEPMAAIDPDAMAWATAAGTAPVAENALGWVDFGDEKFWNPDPAVWFIPGMLIEGEVCTIYSAGGQGKSLLAQDIAYGLVERGTVFGQPVEPQPVLYIDRENSARGLSKRLRAMGHAGGPLPLLHYSLLGAWPALDSRAGGAALLKAVRETGAKLVVLDTMSKMVDGEENANDTWNGLHSNSMVALKQEGVTVLQLDHTGKDADRGQRGGSSKQNNADVIWKLSFAAGYVELKNEKDREGEYDPLVYLERQTLPRLEHRNTGVVPAAASRAMAAEEKVDELVAALEDLSVPVETGRDKAWAQLREAGVSCQKDDVMKAQKARREQVPAQPGIQPESQPNSA